jgi:hypothetical protein
MRNIAPVTTRNRWSRIILPVVALAAAAEPIITGKSAPDGGTLLACLIIGFIALRAAQRRTGGNR